MHGLIFLRLSVGHPLIQPYFGRFTLNSVGRSRLILHVAQLGQWNMTADRMARPGGSPRWRLIVTDVTDMPGAPAMKRTSLSRGEQVYRVSWVRGGQWILF